MMKTELGNSITSCARIYCFFFFKFAGTRPQPKTSIYEYFYGNKSYRKLISGMGVWGSPGQGNYRNVKMVYVTLT